eukprot:2590696-Amphidinium_carterae.2
MILCAFDHSIEALQLRLGGCQKCQWISIPLRFSSCFGAKHNSIPVSISSGEAEWYGCMKAGSGLIGLLAASSKECFSQMWEDQAWLQGAIQRKFSLSASVRLVQIQRIDDEAHGTNVGEKNT